MKKTITLLSTFLMVTSLTFVNAQSTTGSSTSGSSKSKSTKSTSGSGATTSTNEMNSGTTTGTMDTSGSSGSGTTTSGSGTGSTTSGTTSGSTTHGKSGEAHDSHDGHGHSDAAPGHNKPSAGQLNETDKTFCMKACSAGLYEVESGKLAMTQGQDQAIKDFGKMMSQDHMKSSKELEKICKAKGMTMPKEMMSEDKAMLDKLKSKKGKDFDAEYAQQMVTSHEKAVSLFNDASHTSTDADVKKYADETLPTLKHHLEMANDLLKKTGAKK